MADRRLLDRLKDGPCFCTERAVTGLWNVPSQGDWRACPSHPMKWSPAIEDKHPEYYRSPTPPCCPNTGAGHELDCPNRP